MNLSQEQQMQEQYPGVDLAYSIALSSYESALKRLESIDNRLQAVLTIGVAVSLPVLPIVSSKNIHFHSIWFYLATVAFVSALTVGVYAKFLGRVMLMNPSMFYQKWLHFTDWEFKKNFIYFAGEHFEANRKLAETRSFFMYISASLFLLEGLLVAVWASVARP